MRNYSEDLKIFVTDDDDDSEDELTSVPKEDENEGRLFKRRICCRRWY